MCQLNLSPCNQGVTNIEIFFRLLSTTLSFQDGCNYKPESSFKPPIHVFLACSTLSLSIYVVYPASLMMSGICNI